MKESTLEWLSSAESDLSLIKEIRSVEDLTHLAAFHAQQAIEKSFKGIIEEFEIGFVKTHSLETLYSLVKDRINEEINIDMLIILDQLYIDARYPGELGLLPNGKPSLSEAEEFLEYAEMIFSIAKAVCG